MGGILAYLEDDGKFSEFAHKARWGIPNTTMTIPEGTMWGAAFNPANLTRTARGTGTFSFTSCGAGHIALFPNEVMLANGFTSLEYDIKRDLLTPGIECPTSAK